MASIHDEGGRYRVRWRETHGGITRNRSRTVATKAAAAQLKRDIDRSHDRGQVYTSEREAAAQAPGLGEVMLRYTLEVPTARTSKALAATVSDLFLGWLRARLGREPIPADLSRGLLQEWRVHLEERLQPGSVRTYMGVVDRAWAWAWDQDDRPGWEGAIPRHREVVKPKVPAADIIAPSWDDWAKLLAQLDPSGWMWRLVILARYTGMRRSAALALRWRDIDLDAGEIVVRPSSTKAGASGRHLPIAPALAAELALWPRATAGGLVVGYTGRRASQMIRRAWGRAGVDSEVWSRRPIHAMRRTLTDHLTREGFADRVGQALLGHRASGTGSTMGRFYRPERSLWDDLVEAVGTIPEHPIGGAAMVLAFPPTASAAEAK